MCLAGDFGGLGVVAFSVYPDAVLTVRPGLLKCLLTAVHCCGVSFNPKELKEQAS